MTRYVVDASVGIKWFLPEEQSDAAQRLRQGQSLHVPEFFSVEVANVLCRRVRGGDLPLRDAREIFETLRVLPLHRYPDALILPMAFDLAIETRQSLYDALYLALAVMIEGTLVTADQKLLNSPPAAAVRRFLLWVGDLPQ